jgi:hypothetical protein
MLAVVLVLDSVFNPVVVVVLPLTAALVPPFAAEPKRALLSFAKLILSTTSYDFLPPLFRIRPQFPIFYSLCSREKLHDDLQIFQFNIKFTHRNNV